MRVVRLALVSIASIASIVALAACGEDVIDARSLAPDAGPRDAAPLPDAGPIDGAPPTPADVAPLVAPIRDQYGLPALATLVVRHGALVAAGVTGVRKTGGATPATLGDRFAVGENVQAITATLAAALVEAGVVTWTTTLGDVLAGIHPSYENVSLEALVSQRGGAPAKIPADVLARARTDAGSPRAVRESAARAIAQAPPESAAGTVHESDASFLLAAVMLEAKANASWEDLVRTRIFQPLGIGTCAPGPATASPAEDVPWGHVPIEASLSPVTPGTDPEPPAALAPALGLRCSIEDVARFAGLHLRGTRGEPTPILGAPSLAKLETPVDGMHALGWFAVSRTFAGAKLALTSGSHEASAYARVWVMPDKDAIVVAATNQGGQASIKGVDDAIGELIGRFVIP